MPRRGARRKKRRTHVVDDGTATNQTISAKISTGAIAPTPEATKKVPKSFVVRRGKVGKGVIRLIDDLRTVMLPNTAKNLKDRKNASIKDYVSVAGDLAVTHILALSQTKRGPNLRIGRIPRGPTLTFHVSSYCLSSDIRNIARKQLDVSLAFQTAPLVVLNNFETDGSEQTRHLKIIALTFQAMFPAINVQTTNLSQCRRVLLIHYNADTENVEIRHFIIRATPKGISRPVKRILKTKVPNLHNCEDISEALLGNVLNGYATSDSENEDEAACVTMPQDYNAGGRGNKAHSQSVIKLSEIGPRLSLQLIKVEDGLFTGEVQYHAYVKKTEDEIEALRETHEEKEALRLERKAIQEANVQRKKDLLEEKKQKRQERRQKRHEEATNAITAVYDSGQDSEQDSGEEGDEEDPSAFDENLDDADDSDGNSDDSDNEDDNVNNSDDVDDQQTDNKRKATASSNSKSKKLKR